MKQWTDRGMIIATICESDAKLFSKANSIIMTLKRMR
jgi:hypothetical protein